MKLSILDSGLMLKLSLTLSLLSLLLPLHQAHAISDIDDLTPVSHWTCDETSGVRYDSNTTNSNDLTDNNTVGYATGLRGNACDFESTDNEYLSITDADHQGLEPSTEITINAWVKRESTSGIYLLQKDTNGGGDPSYFMAVRDDVTDLWSILTAGGVKTGVYGGSLNDGVWGMFTFTYDGANMKVYKDGSLESTQAKTGTIDYAGTYPFYIGKLHHCCNWDGLADEITFDDTAWTLAQIQEVYNSGTPLPYTATSTPSEPTASSTATSTTLSQSANDAIILGGFSLFGLFLLGVVLSIAMSVVWIIRA